MLNKINDPIGLALYDHLNGINQSKLVVKTTVALDEELDSSYFFRDFNAMPPIEQMALHKCKGKILDVGAGAGSHSLYLQNQNYLVEAIDVSPYSVEVMKNRGVKNAFLKNFYSIKNKKFDTILFLMNGFGMSAKLDNVPDFLNHCMSLLETNGQLLFDSSDIKYLYEQEDGSFLFDLNSLYYGEVTYQISYKQIQGEPFNWLFIDIDNLKGICDDINLTLDILMEDSHYQYLARITKT